MQGGYWKRLLRLELIDHPAIAGAQAGHGAALGRGSVEVSIRILNETSHWLIPIRSATERGKIVNDAFDPGASLLRYNLINCTAGVAICGLSATISGPEKIAVRIHRRILERQFAIGRSVKQIGRAFAPGPTAHRRELVDRSITQRSTVGRGAIHIPACVKHQPAVGDTAFR